MRTDQIIKRAGGAKFIAWKLDLHQITVMRWYKTGIPAKYWSDIIRFSGGTITAAHLLETTKTK